MSYRCVTLPKLIFGGALFDWLEGNYVLIFILKHGRDGPE